MAAGPAGPVAPGPPTAVPPLAAVELVRVVLPLRAPLRSGHGEESVRDVVLVRVEDDAGGEGWGECSALARPTYTHEHTAGAWAVLRDELAPAALAGQVPAVRTHPMAAAALEVARVDAALRRAGRSLAEALGATRDRVPVTAVLGRPDGGVRDLVEAAAACLDEGAALVKVKVHPGWDTAPLTALRHELPDAPLAADANGTYGEDPDRLGVLAEVGLAYLEQPAPADELRASADVADAVGVPVALDESITSPGATDAALALRAGSVVNVKPARVGGLARAAACAEVAVGWNARCFVGGMLETGVGRATAVALAAGDVFSLPCDLGPSSRYFDEDVTEPIELDAGGRLLVPRGPGLGVAPRPERLAEVAVERLVLRR